MGKGAEMKFSKSKLAVAIYIAVEAALLLLIKLLENIVDYDLIRRLMFFAIVLDFALISFCYIWKKKRDERKKAPLAFIFLGMLFTLLADTFLVLINDFYIVGVILFCAVQTLYALYLGMSLKQVLARLALFAVLLIIIVLAGRLDLLSGFSAYSMAMLSINAVTAWLKYGKDKTTARLLLALGLTLFFCCDANVGIMNATAANTMLNVVSAWLIWVFYIPSQVLIVLSFIYNAQDAENALKEMA